MASAVSSPARTKGEEIFWAGHPHDRSLEAGKLANLTILSDDIVKIPGSEILRTRWLMAAVSGEIVYGP